EGEEEHHEAAMREVAEETGISGDILTELGHIEYTFTVPGRRIHKTVHHFLLRATGGELTIENDPDHEAVDVAWVDVDRLTGQLTFLNERRIVEMARDLMAQFFDISPAPAIMRPRRIIPMMRRLPSGLNPAQFRADDADAAKKPPTPHQSETESDTDNTPTDSQVTTDNVPKDSTTESSSPQPEQPKIPKPSAELFEKHRKRNTCPKPNRQTPRTLPGPDPWLPVLQHSWVLEH